MGNGRIIAPLFIWGTDKSIIRETP
jgi:hypothetical protein